MLYIRLWSLLLLVSYFHPLVLGQRDSRLRVLNQTVEGYVPLKRLTSANITRSVCTIRWRVVCVGVCCWSGVAQCGVVLAGVLYVYIQYISLLLLLNQGTNVDYCLVVCSYTLCKAYVPISYILTVACALCTLVARCLLWWWVLLVLCYVLRILLNVLFCYMYFIQFCLSHICVWLLFVVWWCVCFVSGVWYCVLHVKRRYCYRVTGF